MELVPSGSQSHQSCKTDLSRTNSVPTSQFLLDSCRIGTFGHSYALTVEFLGSMILYRLTLFLPPSISLIDGDELCDWAMSGQNNLMSLCYNAWLFIGTVSFLKTEVLLQAPEKCHKVLVVMQCPVFVAYWLISITGNQSAGLHLKQLNS